MADKGFIKELSIYRDETDNIFNSEKPYRIPLYQRPFAWEDRELIQLLEDIQDCSGEHYYLGSLIVADNGDFFEVVDGQQRLTALYLLLTFFEKKFKPNLRFACRDKSNYTLDNIVEIMSNANGIDVDKVQDSIVAGMKVLEKELSAPKKYGNDFADKLANVIMYRIVVPPHTDLNRYFETMNTRGEQLEQHDILKAQLMSYYDKEDTVGQNSFAMVWDACRDMDGYVQMHFDVQTRGILFGSDWNGGILLGGDWEKERARKIINEVSIGQKGSAPKPISELIMPEYTREQTLVDYDGKDVKVRFESIIDFPYFLLHCLKVYVDDNKLESDDGRNLCDSLLNDKKLKVSFDRVISHGLKSGKYMDKADFARDFILLLLKTRLLYDRYIIKREYVGESFDGNWSLKTLVVTNNGNKPYFKNTEFHVYRENYKKTWPRHAPILMMQSALRVSYTSPKVMHWITELLKWLYKYDNRASRFNRYLTLAEKVAVRSIKDGFLDVCEDGKYCMGVNTPHIVFNYLDYLLWDRNRNLYKDFSFEFRNSVEHWYPRHPSETELRQWEDVDRFGNLCILPRDINSKFSNLPPEGKRILCIEKVKKDNKEKDSLKLRKMRDLTIPNGTDSGSVYWRDEACAIHEAEMITILKEAVERVCNKTN